MNRFRKYKKDRKKERKKTKKIYESLVHMI